MSSRVQRQLLGYAVTGAAALSGSQQDAKAAIIHTIPDPPLSPASNSTLGIDMTGDTMPEFQLVHNFSTSMGEGGLFVQAGITGASAIQDGGSVNYAAALNSGAAISSGQPLVGPGSRRLFALQDYTGTNYNSKFSRGPWLNRTNGMDGFLGVKFDVGGQSHFGWLRLSVAGFNSPGGDVTVHEFAYNDEPNAPITAGQIPEPGCLGLLALGATGILAWRRVRKDPVND